jgi:hypothetical protein
MAWGVVRHAVSRLKSCHSPSQCVPCEQGPPRWAWPLRSVSRAGVLEVYRFECEFHRFVHRPDRRSKASVGLHLLRVAQHQGLHLLREADMLAAMGADTLAAVEAIGPGPSAWSSRTT